MTTNTQTKIQILSPMPKTKLGRFRGRTGVFVIRQGDRILYVGWATDIYSTATRYFGKSKSLSKYNIRKVTFEVVLCSCRKARVLTRILRQYLKPLHNTTYLGMKLNRYEQQQHNRLLTLYRQDSFFEETKGEHKTDTP